MREKRAGFAEWASIWGAAAAILCAPIGCSHAPPPAATSTPAPPTPPAIPPCTAPEPLRVVVGASHRLNPGEKGEALATVVRLYQLKGLSKLMGVSFDDLLDHDKEALGDDLLGAQEITINPGERLDPAVKRNPEAAYLLAVALFRQPAGTTWKVVRKLAPPDADYCHAPADRARAARMNDGAVRLFLDENRLELR